MIYGMYLSATGVIASSYRQDVIANNLANSEAMGFKKDLALIQARPTAAQETGDSQSANPMLENIGGGMFLAPTLIDTTQGELEPTGNPLDVAIQGPGYFAVNQGGQTRLTRSGQFVIDHNGQLAVAADGGPTVLDKDQNPVALDPSFPAIIANDGTISQQGKAVAQLGVFGVSDPTMLQKQGGTLFSLKQGAQMTPIASTFRPETLERSNVDPATELTELMDAQRQLEANANMIKTQDETLSKLVSDVGKVS
jgi:flagellar basal body rod protein FlgG